jgi:hypothetical protein
MDGLLCFNEMCFEGLPGFVEFWLGLPFSEVACKSGGGGEHNGAKVDELGLGGGGAGVVGHLSIYLLIWVNRLTMGREWLYTMASVSLRAAARAWGEIFPYVL